MSLPVPPANLIERVGPFQSDASYDQSAPVTRSFIDRMLPADWTWEGKRVLDFGCGAGRILRTFDPTIGEFWGCDIHRPSIEWLRENTPFNAFVNDELPPLPQPDGYFDLVYAMSVYTHLTEENWASWLLEHHRVLRPGGLLLATFLGEGMIQPLIGEPWDDQHIGMNTLTLWNPWDLGGPTTFNSPWWLRAHWGRAFDIVDLMPFSSGPERPEGHGLILGRKQSVMLTVDQLKELEPSEPREITALQHHVRQLQAETMHLGSGLNESHQEYARLTREIDTMHSSKSWRLTAPLRNVRRHLSKGSLGTH
jgi:SAM-dependent methyltransferase